MLPRHSPKLEYETTVATHGILYVMIGAVLWSTGGVGIKLLDGYSPLTINTGRAAVCVLFFACALRGRLIPPRGARRTTIIGAVAYAIVISSFVAATKWTTAANAVILQNTSILWIALVGWAVLRERPTRVDYAVLSIGFMGIVLCMADGITWFSQSGEVSRALIGDVVAIISGASFAVLIVTLRAANRGSGADGTGRPSGALWCIFWGSVLASLVGLPSFVRELPTPGIVGHARATGWLVLAWLGLFQLALGYWFYQRGLRTTKALTASLVALCEPVLNALLVALAIGEVPSRYTIVGGMIVLGAISVKILKSEE